jgi:hypothetical protein
MLNDIFLLKNIETTMHWINLGQPCLTLETLDRGHEPVIIESK